MSSVAEYLVPYYLIQCNKDITGSTEYTSILCRKVVAELLDIRCTECRVNTVVTSAVCSEYVLKDEVHKNTPSSLSVSVTDVVC